MLVDGSQVRGKDGKLSTLTIKCEVLPEDSSSEARKAALKSPLLKDVPNKVCIIIYAGVTCQLSLEDSTQDC